MILKSGNVERVVENAAAIEKLKKLGFEEVGCAAEAKKPKQEPADLESVKADELKAVVKEKGIEGYSSLKRDELLAVLKEVI